MNVRSIDHLNLAIPDDGIEAARRFYVDGLGLSLDNVDRFESGDKPFFDVRLSSEHVLHLRPTDGFVEPDGTDYHHVALVVEEDIETVRARLAEAGIDIERELDGPLGATGEADAVYVRDPFGYRVELKEPVAEG
ncbi:VOC family protein [Candidatus Halobonum tyrrellensis]|uniref:Glyoxalase/bleomycin resistance protein/dioxygenase n=1 Tax=Candidatus Halobonum tyrrellensis G22 TaxID=1324957 RepID=V4HII8_9EURY|nr:VOC family protein [Candidatus Halobonum tyrrellensis]ESP89598.1 glyoxalase/bleomycin resistance protein/dioxygenase [Candidatus Halobonum tyrrellensis G22]